MRNIDGAGPDLWEDSTQAKIKVKILPDYQ